MSKLSIQLKKSNIPPEFFTVLETKGEYNIPLSIGLYGIFDRKSLTAPCIITKVCLENEKTNSKVEEEFKRYVGANVQALSNAALIDLFGFTKNFNYKR
jgi:hypothetical protein